jgi:hypothetical protein
MTKYCDGRETDLHILTDVYIFSTPDYESLVYMRRHCDDEENQPKDFDGFTLFQHPQIQKCSFGILSVCIYISLTST